MGLRAIPTLAPSEDKSHRAAQTAHSHVDFSTQPAARTAQGRIFSPPLFRAGSVLMGANDGAVHDQVFKIRIVSHGFENAKPNTLLAPAAKAAEYAVPLAKGFR
jgi:hypothetical protein